MATREGIEPPPMVLETIALPLYYPAKLTHCYQCVYRSTLTKSPVFLSGGEVCFDTLEFYQLRCRHSLLILQAAHIIAVFSVSAGSRSLCHIMKNPGVFSSGVLVRYTNIV